MKIPLYALSLFVLFFAVSPASAQGILVNETTTPMQLPRTSVWPGHVPPGMGGSRPPVRPVPVSVQSYSIKELNVDAKIKDQIAEVNLTQIFTNTGSVQMEVSFVFPLPYDGAIDQMVLLVDGKEYPAKLQDASAARKTYEEIVRKNRDPALLEWLGNGLFQSSVFPVPAGASRTITIRYSQLLRKEGGVCDFLFPLSTAKYTSKPVEKLSISLQLETSEELKNVYSPTHEIKLSRPDAKHASATFEASNTVPFSDFRLLFDSGEGELSTRILSYRPEEKEDGFFLLLASPKIVAKEEKPLPKTVVLVLDRSGSMSGEKIVQARDAMKFVLERLNPEDTFNIVTYNDRVEVFQPEIVAYDSENRNLGLSYCEAIRASGGTNIGDALKVSLGMLQDSKQPSYVLFFTDGCPTTGERNEMKLAEIAKESNKVKARIFSFGVGFDVNSRLLDRISRDNRGETEFVLPNENIEERVAWLYNRIGSPILTDVNFTIATSGGSYGTNQVYPSGSFDLFAGQQLVILGRYSKPGEAEVQVKGKIGENEHLYKFDGNFVEKSNDQSYGFIERLWAMRRIGEILDQIDLKGKNQELVDELIRLSTKHGILTPYTAFLADESTVLTARSENFRSLDRNLDALQASSGSSGVMQRGGKMELQKSANLAESGSRRFSGALPTESADTSRGSAGFPAQAGIRPRVAQGGMGAGSGMGGGRSMAAVPAQGQVQSINNRAFFQKGDTWIDSTLTAEQQNAENVITVKQFSDEYFKLIDQHGKELAQYLVFDESVLVNFNGQAYRFEP